jgi:hypothetical protein
MLLYHQSKYTPLFAAQGLSPSMPGAALERCLKNQRAERRFCFHLQMRLLRIPKDARSRNNFETTSEG